MLQQVNTMYNKYIPISILGRLAGTQSRCDCLYLRIVDIKAIPLMLYRRYTHCSVELIKKQQNTHEKVIISN